MVRLRMHLITAFAGKTPTPGTTTIAQTGVCTPVSAADIALRNQLRFAAVGKQAVSAPIRKGSNLRQQSDRSFKRSDIRASFSDEIQLKSNRIRWSSALIICESGNKVNRRFSHFQTWDQRNWSVDEVVIIASSWNVLPYG